MVTNGKKNLKEFLNKKVRIKKSKGVIKIKLKGLLVMLLTLLLITGCGSVEIEGTERFEGSGDFEGIVVEDFKADIRGDEAVATGRIHNQNESVNFVNMEIAIVLYDENDSIVDRSENIKIGNLTEGDSTSFRGTFDKPEPGEYYMDLDISTGFVDVEKLEQMTW